MKFRVLLCLIYALLSLPVLTFANESWTRIASTNFTLVGNVDEKEIRGVGIKLERFRETFQELFPSRKFNTGQITVFVFKNSQDLKSFQPVRTESDAGNSPRSYLISGDGINYIALSADSESSKAFQSIFHDYIHFIINKNFGRPVAPPWINEGLAEYYQTFRFENEMNSHLGEVPEENLRLLQEQSLIPLERFFAFDYYTLRNQGNHGKSIFYAESWALIHYLQEGNKGVRREQLKTFLNFLIDNQPPSVAFEKAFQTDYAGMEKELKTYVAQRSFTNRIVALKNNPNFNLEMQSESLTDSDIMTYQGDLLLHLNRLDEAVNLLQRAVALDPKNAFAYASLGATLARQNKFDEARSLFEKSISLAPKNHLPYFYYADAIRRQAVTDENFARPFTDEQSERIAELLERTIQLNPDFAEAYRLSAFVNFANNRNLNDAVATLNKAILIEPGNEHYALDLGRVYYRQEKFDQARNLARKVFAFAEEAGTRAKAQVLLSNVNSLEEQLRLIRERNARRDKGEKESSTIEYTPEELINQSLNEALRKPRPGEKRMVGYLSNINCEDKEINFLVRTKDQSVNQMLKLRADDFLSVAFMAFTAEANGKQMGCGVRKPEDFVVVTYRSSSSEVKTDSDGGIVAVEFVPKTFVLKP
jgi:Flp pilus assembly protein TadD